MQLNLLLITHIKIVRILNFYLYIWQLCPFAFSAPKLDLQIEEAEMGSKRKKKKNKKEFIFELMLQRERRKKCMENKNS